MPEWYVSYAWGDDLTPEGRAREEIVDKLCNAATARGHTILRDKDVLSLGCSITSFMQRIGTGDRVFVILSDKYLRSPHCMFELSEIWRTSSQEGKAFLERVQPGRKSVSGTGARLRAGGCKNLEAHGLGGLGDLLEAGTRRSKAAYVSMAPSF